MRWMMMFCVCNVVFSFILIFSAAGRFQTTSMISKRKTFPSTTRKRERDHFYSALKMHSIMLSGAEKSLQFFFHPSLSWDKNIFYSVTEKNTTKELCSKEKSSELSDKTFTSDSRPHNLIRFWCCAKKEMKLRFTVAMPRKTRIAGISNWKPG